MTEIMKDFEEFCKEFNFKLNFAKTGTDDYNYYNNKETDHIYKAFKYSPEWRKYRENNRS